MVTLANKTIITTKRDYPSKEISFMFKFKMYKKLTENVGYVMITMANKNNCCQGNVNRKG